jgi:hypothetical protein
MNYAIGGTFAAHRCHRGSFRLSAVALQSSLLAAKATVELASSQWQTMLNGGIFAHSTKPGTDMIAGLGSMYQDASVLECVMPVSGSCVDMAGVALQLEEKVHVYIGF